MSKIIPSSAGTPSAVLQKWITKYVIVEEHAATALDFFSLTRESLGAGYPYSISELVSIFLCRSEFLLHYAGDCLPAGRCDWVSPSIQFMQRDQRIKVCNLSWNENYQEAKSESFEEVEDFYIGYGFSDQCYLVRTKDFQAPIYDESHPASARYPRYGGELFEKRVDAWMRNHNHLRATYKHASYIHKNAPLLLAQFVKLFGTKCFRKARKLWPLKFSLLADGNFWRVANAGTQNKSTRDAMDRLLPPAGKASVR